MTWCQKKYIFHSQNLRRYFKEFSIHNQYFGLPSETKPKSFQIQNSSTSHHAVKKSKYIKTIFIIFGFLREIAVWNNYYGYFYLSIYLIKYITNAYITRFFSREHMIQQFCFTMILRAFPFLNRSILLRSFQPARYSYFYLQSYLHHPRPGLIIRNVSWVTSSTYIGMLSQLSF